MNIISSIPRVKETTAMQIVCVIAWLWVIPVIDSLESYSYGAATKALITSFIPFVIGIISAVSLPEGITRKYGRAALIIGCVILAFSLVLYVQLLYFPYGFHLYSYNCGLFRIIGFILLGYGLRTTDAFSEPMSFKTGVLVLFVLYVTYNLLLWGTNNPHPDWMFLYHLSNILFAMARIAIVIVLWKTLSTDSVAVFLDKKPRLSLLVAGLLWGMFFVKPVDSYESRWVAVTMLILSPLYAYVMTVLVRFAAKSLIYLLKGVWTNKCWWRESCCWWTDKSRTQEIK